jgi:type VI secretion system VgrG family protein
VFCTLHAADGSATRFDRRSAARAGAGSKKKKKGDPVATKHDFAFTFSTAVTREGAFTVARFTGEEEISGLYRFEVDLVVEDPDLDVHDLPGEEATLRMLHGAGGRVVHGVVTEVETLTQVDDGIVARAVLRPRVWQLTHATANRVHLDRSTPEVIRDVLDHVGITEADHDHDLIDDYQASPFRLQYGEMHWQFLSRILERDGIYYFFASDTSHERLVFCDHFRTQPSIEDAEVQFVGGLGMVANRRAAAVRSLVTQSRQLPARVAVRNYNDERPSSAIQAEAEIDPRGSGTIDVFGENVRHEHEAHRLAQIRAQEVACTRLQAHGAGSVARFAAGHQFRLTGHPDARANREYLLVRVEHEGSVPDVLQRIGQAPTEDQPTYENHFSAIPADVQYRPPRRTEKPRIHGHLNAAIDAEGAGEFAEIDEEGRYHVVFPFDAAREAGNASHWIRLVQPYAGTREGMHFPLRKGARVLIGFIGGDPDLPVISGSIPNAEQPSITAADNLARANIRSASGNLIELDDETPRIKMYCPTRRTYMHLGAPNAPGEGIVSATDGLSQWMSLGGVNMVSATQGWLVESTIWPTPTSDERNVELNWYTLNEAAARESESEWTIDDTLERLFRFPLKHKRPTEDDLKHRPYHDEATMGTDEDFLTREDELSNLVHASRSIGESYSYRSGTDFAFVGPQREAFTFGPLAALDSHDHNADPEELRGALASILQEFGDSSAWDDLEGEDRDAYQKARIDYRIAREKRLRREALCIWRTPVTIDADVLNSEKHRSLQQRFLDGLPADDAERTTRIRIVVANAGKAVRDRYCGDLEKDVRGELTEDEGEHLDENMLGVVYASDIADQLNDPETIDPHRAGTSAAEFASWFSQNIHPQASEGESAGLDYSVEAGEFDADSDKFLVDLIAKHTRAHAAYDEAWEKVREQKDADLGKRLRNGRLNVADLTSVSVHHGESVSYTAGASYSETHVRSISADDRVRGCTVSFTKKDEDRAKYSGPNFNSLDVRVRAYDAEEDDFDGKWSPGNVNVSKVYGNTYSYQKGSSLAVQVGESHTVNRLSRAIVETVDPNAGGVIRYAETSTGVQGKEFGLHTFTTQHVPGFHLTLNAFLQKNTTINTMGIMNNTINAGFSMTNTLNVGGIANVNLSGGYVKTFNLTGGKVFEFNSQKSKLEIDVDNLKVSNQTMSAMIHTTMVDLQAAKSSLYSVNNELSTVKTNIRKAAVVLNTATNSLGFVSAAKIQRAGMLLYT